MHLDAGPIPSVARRHQVTTTAIATADAAGAQQARAEPVDPEAPGQEQRVLLGVRAAADKAELPKTHLSLHLVVVVLLLFLLVPGGVAGRERLDRLKRRRPGAGCALAGRREEVVVVRRAAGQGGEVALRAGAAHAGAVPAQALVVGAAAGEVAGDGRRVVGGHRRLGEVDGRGGGPRRVAARREERAEDRRGAAPHKHGYRSSRLSSSLITTTDTPCRSV
uniref:Uncharacterized protein n=1 Tax=Arundo donax TaxID=35708 RepID=A0A0A9G6V5_ARUDO